jgi:hypothetical protein
MMATLAPLAVAAAACTRSGSRPTDSAADTGSPTGSPNRAHATTLGTCGTDVRNLAEQLGARMRLVSLLAPDSIVRRSLADAYGTLVSAPLLTEWQNDPRNAPGRELSNPWPQRLDVRSIDADGTACRVEGDIVYVTSADTTTPVERRTVSLRIESGPSPRITEYRVTNAAAPAGGTQPTTDSSQAHVHAAAEVVRQYYRDIQRRDFDAAYDRWGTAGRASGQTRAAFAAGFANVATVAATVADSGAVEGAAGSQYVTVPVRVDATLRDGTRQHFAGTYTMRRTLVDGATAAQRRWHIFKADVTAQKE